MTDSIWIRISEEPIDAEALRRRVTRQDCGAIVAFAGTVRDHSEGRNVTRIRYTAFREMAEKECTTIARAAVGRWPVRAIAIEHRLGMLNLTDISIAIAVAAVHRAEAFEACRFLIEEIKKTTPIWKEEFTPDGKHWTNAPSA